MRKLFVVGTALLAACGDGTGPEDGNRNLTVGGSRQLDPQERTTLTVEGGAEGAEYTLVPFYADSFYTTNAVSNIERTDNTWRKVDLRVTATGVETTTAPPSPLRAPAPGGPLLALGTTGGEAAAGGTELRPDVRWHTRFLRDGQRQLAGRLPLIAAASRAPLAGSASRSVAPRAVSAVGDEVSYNTNANEYCENAVRRRGRVAAVTERAVVVSDVTNPVGGFTDADFRQFGAQFDTLIYKLDTDNFGTPGDVDANGGRVVIFFTRAVNELTPRNSSFYVGGFFSPRDLFPIPADASQDYDGCAGSNFSEMFYMLAPDPAGAVNGNVRSTAFVRGVTTRTIAHEFQHLINFSKRLTNNARYDEDVWLNEGLSHAAEELLFYRASGARPGSNLDASQVVVTGSPYGAAWTEYGKGVIDLVSSYVTKPEANSPYADNDSLATRGASWQLVRYLVDQKGGTQSNTFKSLVNTTAYGLKNLSNVFGADAMNLVRDWTVAQYADDARVVGANARYTHPSWNFRDILSRYSANQGRFPLPVRQLASTAPVDFSLYGGGTTYLRFRVPANGTATITTATQSGAVVPATLRYTLLRTQ